MNFTKERREELKAIFLKIESSQAARNQLVGKIPISSIREIKLMIERDEAEEKLANQPIIEEQELSWFNKLTNKFKNR